MKPTHVRVTIELSVNADPDTADKIARALALNAAQDWLDNGCVKTAKLVVSEGASDYCPYGRTHRNGQPCSACTDS